ncbi:C2H2-type zinc finger transcription factor [Mucor lusitanicus CBS 277.49]|uniref:C2H2-type zinc finger transcription factor n=1 Tax=Mucor lusitanicus CBS 277.49 TaxID=747725 RepID=A0A168H6M1_MUCCL|nr:C2H2-type zinc finger transcription factor [Mucor lusitanicus CBS 277.49]
MKLRNRKEWVLGNIKQEDQKLGIALGDASSSIVNRPTMSGVNLKQEDTKEHEKLLKQRLLSECGKADYYYRCEMCNAKMESLRSVLEHRKSVHNIDANRSTNRRKIKHIDEEPDVYDPNFYCRLCEKGYLRIADYRVHLRNAHFMALKPLPIWKPPPTNSSVPDPDDPNLYCKACNHKYKSKQYYKSHCQFIHGLAPTESDHPQSVPAAMKDVSTYCQLCDRYFSTKENYCQHRLNIHKVIERPTKIQKPKGSNTVPDVDDPNFYCRPCDKTLAHKNSFRTHLKLVHSIFQSAPRNKSSIKPDIEDPNNFCRACQKTYPSRRKYRAHLCLVHHMILTPLASNTNLKELPDPLNSDYYCRVCARQKLTSTTPNGIAHNVSARTLALKYSKYI